MQSITLLDTTSGKINVTGQPQKGAGYSNTIGNNHTISIGLNNFTGRIYIEGTLSTDPKEEDWVPIPLINNNPYIQFPKNILKPVGDMSAYGQATGDSGNFAYSFTGNFIWLRARVDRTYISPPPVNANLVGSVIKILLNYGSVSPASTVPLSSESPSQGLQGPPGPQGPKGARGPTGPSASSVEITTGNLNLTALIEAVDDSTAASLGVPVNGIYHYQGSIKIRLV